MRKTALAIFFSFSSLVGYAQAPAIQWDKTLGGTYYDYLSEIVQTSDGGYMLGGFSNSGISIDKSHPAKGTFDYWILKLDINGNKLWDKTIGGNASDALRSLAQTSDGGYILGGDSESSISGDKSQANKGLSDYWVIKLDANGNKIWDKTYGGNNKERLYSLAQTSDGGYILGGFSESDISGDKTQPSNGKEDYWIIKLDTNGNKQWEKSYGGNQVDKLYSIIQTSDGGYLMGGESYSSISIDKTQPSKGGIDYWAIKVDANGIKLWDKTIGGNNSDVLRKLIQTQDGGYVLGGVSYSTVSGDKTKPSRGFSDYWVVKLDAGGIKLWDQSFGGSDGDSFSSMQQIQDGSYILGGRSDSPISGDKTEPCRDVGPAIKNDFWIVKIDANGTKIWDKTFGGTNWDGLESLTQTTDGGYFLGGFSESGISVDKTQVSQGSTDYWIVKLGPDQTTGINESTTSLNLSVSPNPSQGKFQLQLNNLTTKTAEVTVSDLVGRVFYQQQIPVTQKQLLQEINRPQLKGMYLLQVTAGKEKYTRKIIVE